MEFTWAVEDYPFPAENGLNETIVEPKSSQPLPPSAGQSRHSRKGRTDGGTSHLTESYKLAVIHIALRQKDAYGASGVTDAKFWRTVADELS